MRKVFSEIVQGAHPVVSAVTAASMVILAVLLLVHPAILAWIVAIGLILAAVGVIASAISGNSRARA
jgi:VIT1/CCC1 family predicted Fe2+/Mn2+ transporter